jgi:hypothetical protein
MAFSLFGVTTEMAWFVNILRDTLTPPVIANEGMANNPCQDVQWSEAISNQDMGESLEIASLHSRTDSFTVANPSLAMTFCWSTASAMRQ